MSRERMRIARALGLTLAIAGCSAEVGQRPTERPLESYSYRAAIQLSDGSAFVCYTDTLPLREDMPWTIYIDKGYCPDEDKNKEVLGSKDVDVKDISLDILNNNFQLVDQKSLRESGQEIPPVYFGE